MGPQLEIRVAHRDRNYRDVGATLGIGFATKTAAIPAVLASTVFRPVGIGVGERRIRGRPWERMIAVLARGLGEQLAREDRSERRQRIFGRTRRLEEIAAGLDLAANIAGLAGHRRRALEAIVVRLPPVAGDPPALDAHVVETQRHAII